MPRPKPVVLTIMDGVGHNPDPKNNAVAMANKPNLDRLRATYPSTLIRTDGGFVGLPDGQFGNSEVGHLNIGSGRVIRMDITRIDDMLGRPGSLADNPALQTVMEHGARRRLHILGLCSMGGVHAQLTHIIALVETAKAAGVTDIFLHCFTDGRDTPTESGIEYLARLQAALTRIGVGKIATVSGRYYAMDRDKRWERTERAFNALVVGQGRRSGDPIDALKQSYQTTDENGKKLTDEFVEPIVITANGAPVARIEDGDAVLFANFRADRARQLTLALTSNAPPWPFRAKTLKNLCFVTMTEYAASYPFPVVIPKLAHPNVLGEICAAHGWKNLRTAETEKYPHVTYFFNGGVEKPFAGEEHELVASPKVATYDLQPEMSAKEVCDVVVGAIESDSFDLIVVNFANGDMVGHTGVIPAAVKAVETVDACLGRIEQALKLKDAAWIITADHGNAELLVDPKTGAPHTYHTTFPVPLVLASNFSGRLREDGSLRDISPTILGLMGAELPAEMTGRDLRIFD